MQSSYALVETSPCQEELAPASLVGEESVAGTPTRTSPRWGGIHSHRKGVRSHKPHRGAVQGARERSLLYSCKEHWGGVRCIHSHWGESTYVGAHGRLALKPGDGPLCRWCAVLSAWAKGKRGGKERRSEQERRRAKK
jgi:hypothetical protein